MSLTIITRKQWRARAPKSVDTVPWSDRRLFVVHHSTGSTLGDPNPRTWLRNIQRHHQDVNGWADFGYNWAVDWEGRVYEGRGGNVLGAHVAGHNTEGVGVVVLGDYRAGHDPVNDAILSALRELYHDQSKRAKRLLTPRGHGQLAATACPGLLVNELDVIGIGPPAPPPSKPGTAPGEPVPYPLPSGYYFGPVNGSHWSVSGHYERWFRNRSARSWIQEWVRQLVRRGWPAGKGRRYLGRYGSDGRYGDEHRELIVAFQRDQHLTPDGLLGPKTWHAAYHNPVT